MAKPSLNDVKVVEDEYTGTNPLTDVSRPKAMPAARRVRDVLGYLCRVSEGRYRRHGGGKYRSPRGQRPGGKRVKGDPFIRRSPHRSRSRSPTREKGDHISIVTSLMSRLTRLAARPLEAKVTNDGKVDLTDVTVVEDEYTGTGKVENLSCPKIHASPWMRAWTASATSCRGPTRTLRLTWWSNTAHPRHHPSGKVAGDLFGVRSFRAKPQTPPTTPPTTPPATPAWGYSSLPGDLRLLLLLRRRASPLLCQTGASALALCGWRGLLAGGGAAGAGAARRRGK